MSHIFSLKITAELKNLAEVYQLVETIGATFDLESSIIYDLQLAVDEAVTNIIVHGYRGRQGNIELKIEQEGDAIVVRLFDEAPPFDPATIPSPDLTIPLEKRDLGGLGVYLMQEVMDDVSHRVTANGGNELTMIKRGLDKK